MIPSKTNLKILMVVATFPNPSETFIQSKFLGLQKIFPKLRLFADQIYYERLLEFFKKEEIRQNICKPLSRHPVHIVPNLLFAIAILFITRPNILKKYLWHSLNTNWGQKFKSLYLDIPILKFQPDVIHYEFATLAVQRYYLKSILGAKSIISFRGFELNVTSQGNPKYFENIWKTGDIFHFISEHLKDKALARGLPLSASTIKIPPAVKILPENNHMHTLEKKPASQTLTILSVGRLDWRKGYEHALLALKVAKEKGLSFNYEIIGGGPYLEPVAFAIHQLDLTKYVTLVMEQSHTYVLQKIRECDIFLHLSISEGFGNAVLEAQACGVPVICSKFGGLPENIHHEKTGFLVNPFNPQEICHRLIQLAHNRELRLSMGEKGKSRVLQLFNIEDQLKAFQKMYESVAS